VQDFRPIPLHLCTLALKYYWNLISSTGEEMGCCQSSGAERPKSKLIANAQQPSYAAVQDTNEASALATENYQVATPTTSEPISISSQPISTPDNVDGQPSSLNPEYLRWQSLKK
jgi:hypothetical protein